MAFSLKRIFSRNKGEKALEKVQRTAQDLTTLEINTIVKRVMTGGKPNDEDILALYELAGIYSVELNEMGNKYKKIAPADDGFVVEGEDNFFRKKSIFKGAGIFSFRELEIWSNHAAGWLAKFGYQLGVNETELIEDEHQLRRIGTKCNEMYRMVEDRLDFFNHANSSEYGGQGRKIMYEESEEVRQLLTDSSSDDPSKFWAPALRKITALKKRYDLVTAGKTPIYIWKELDGKDFKNEHGVKRALYGGDSFRFDLRDRLSLRKSIDIGVEMIVMQTRIAMDGDITTRITQGFSENPKQFILDIHNTSIRISVGFWEKIFDALVAFITKTQSGTKSGNN